MAVVSIVRDIGGFGGDIARMEEAIINLQKDLAYILEHIDSANIKSLDAKKTAIYIEGEAAANGSFTSGDGKQVTVSGGVIKSIE